MKQLARLVVSFLTLGLALALPSAPASAAACSSAGSYAAGDGSVGDPYQIATAAQMQYLVDQVRTNNAAVTGKYFVVTTDLDFAGCTLTTSGSSAGFGGFLDGTNRTISNYVISASREAGLFGFITGGLVKDLVISNVSVTSAGPNAGALAGYIQERPGGPVTFLENITVTDSTISSSSNNVGGVTGWSFMEVSLQKIRVVNTSVTGTGQHTGGVVGQVSSDAGSVFSDIRAIATTVNGVNQVGGLFGALGSGVTSAANLGFFAGEVNRTATGAAAADFGGLIGQMGGAVNLSNLAFRGKLSTSTDGTTNIGMLIGNGDSRSFAIQDSYVRGSASVAATDVVAGVIGNNNGAVSITRGYVQMKVTESGSDTEVSSYPVSVDATTLTSFFYDSEVHASWAAEPAGAGKTTAELKDPNTFSSLTGWTTATSANIEAGTASENWYSEIAIQDGYQILVWEVFGKSLAPCPPGRYSFDGLGICDPVPAGSFGAFTGQISFELCPAGTFQPSVGATECIQARPGYFVSTIGAVSDTLCPPGTTSELGAIVCYAIPVSYSGPVVTASKLRVSPGEIVEVFGSRLGSVSAAEVAGQVAVATCTESSCSFLVSNGLAAGLYDLVLTGSHGSLTVQDALFVEVEVKAAHKVRAWTRKLSDGSVKIYAADLVGAGKVQFFLNDEEIAWVRAEANSNHKLREANGSYYLVRTVNLVQGQKNVLEIYVDEVRTKRVAYTY